MIAATSLLLPQADLVDLATIRAFVREAALARGMAGPGVDDVVLVADELATNIIRHGYGGRPGPVDVAVAGDSTAFIMTLRDRAPEFDPTTRPAPDLDVPLERRPVGGMGIHLIRLCIDGMEHRSRPDGGNELVVTLSLNGKGDVGHADHR
ncbi:MAG TPA: ATP-binding protein [Candidatus Limnocylindrales bacterium]|jgi:serine/threonine-protein kinase RsbW